MADAATASTDGNQDEFVCPECGRAFTRAAALGAHRNRAHGVAGSSRSASAGKTARRRRTTASKSGSSSGTKAAATEASGQARTTTGRRSGRAAAPADVRNALLKAAFPKGVPPREDVIRDLAAWLDEGERLAKLA